MSDASGLHLPSLEADTILEHRVYRGTREGRLLLLHPLAMTGNFWAPLIAAWKDRPDILVVDVRGHGRSPTIEGDWWAVDHARDLERLIEIVGWQDLAIAGASMGGCIALEFAARNPAVVTGLGLIDTTAWYGPEAASAWSARARRALEEGMPSMLEFQLSRWFSDAFRDAEKGLVAETAAIFVNNDVRSYMAACRMLGFFDGRPHLGRICCPTTIIVGRDDYATPISMAKALQDGIAGSELHIIEGARHFTPLEKPHEVAACLGRLVGRPI